MKRLKKYGQELQKKKFAPQINVYGAVLNSIRTKSDAGYAAIVSIAECFAMMVQVAQIAAINYRMIYSMNKVTVGKITALCSTINIRSKQ